MHIERLEPGRHDYKLKWQKKTTNEHFMIFDTIYHQFIFYKKIDNSNDLWLQSHFKNETKPLDAY